MGKAARNKKERGNRPAQSAGRLPPRTSPNWPLFGLALIGMALTAYLTISAWSGQEVAGCTVGSDCDLVLNSRWAKLLGLPTSFWGFLAYASLASVAWIKAADTHWKLAWTLALFGLLYSAYLTSVSFVVLKAACPYCLTSLALMAGTFALVTYQRPDGLPGFEWRPWLLKTGTVSVLLVVTLHLNYAGLWANTPRPEDPWIRGLAEHLTKTDAKFYGASWCPHCIDQKEMFGSSVERIPYVECSPNGRSQPQAKDCSDAGIRSYPTWIINGQRHVGAQALENLARYSGYQG